MIRMIGLLALVGSGVVLFASSAGAAVAPSRFRVETKREKSMLRVRRLLQQEQVRDRLGSLGMNRDEIEDRLENLEDAELEVLADRLDSIAVGRGSVGIVIAVLVIAALVLLIVWLVQRV